MPLSNTDVKYYLTSAEHGVEQTIFSQSIGGFAAYVKADATKSLLYPETTFTSSFGLYPTTITVSDYTKLSGSEYLTASGEIIIPGTISSNTLTGLTRGANGVFKIHRSGDVIRGVRSTQVFNKTFNDDLKQYRCFAVRNNNNTLDSLFDTEVYIKTKSRNVGSKYRIAVEIPRSDYFSGAVTEEALTQRIIIDTSLASFLSNHFSGSYLRFTSGANINQARLISSFDNATRTIIVSSDFPFIAEVGDTYEIDPAPCQRVSSGIISPSTGTSRVSSFSEATEDSPISIDILSNRTYGSELKPKDLFYVWVERSLTKSCMEFEANSFVLVTRYLSS